MVVSDRNIHSSIIYQGVVGDLGIDTVCQVNSASMIPDLVFWIDCDPDRAIDRIKHATLRMSSDKQEYFETPEIQKTIRKGFHDLFTGMVAVHLPLTNAVLLDQFSTRVDWMNYVKNCVKNYVHFSIEGQHHSTLMKIKSTDTYSKNCPTMFSNKLGYQVLQWNGLQSTLDG